MKVTEETFSLIGKGAEEVRNGQNWSEVPDFLCIFVSDLIRPKPSSAPGLYLDN